MKRTPMTLRGAEALRAELKKLKTESRPNVIKAIAEARGHGDLSENAEYHAAREQQGFIEGRISEIEAKLGSAEIIDPSKGNIARLKVATIGVSTVNANSFYQYVQTVSVPTSIVGSFLGGDASPRMIQVKAHLTF